MPQAPARIWELRRDGDPIETVQDKKTRMATYFWRGHSTGSETSTPDTPTEPENKSSYLNETERLHDGALPLFAGRDRGHK